MPRIPAPLGYEGEEDLPRTWQTLKNCWRNDKGHIIPRPGITSLNTTGKVARGAFVWNGSMYQVVSNSLIKITNVDTGAFSTIGTIEGSAMIETDIGFNHAVIVVKGGKLYTLSTTDTLTDISGNSNIVPSDDVTHINGRFVYIPSDGSPAYFSDIGAAGTVQAASFFDAEELPDSNKAAYNLRNTLYIFGEDSVELFRDVGTFPVPFARVPGARVQAGYLGGLLEYEDTLIFIGRKKGQGYGIFALSQGSAIRISNPRIDLILQKYTESQLFDAIASRFIWRGYDIATFTLNGDSFGYHKGNWFELDTLFDGVLRTWGGGYITQFAGKYYTAFQDKIGRLDKINTDYGQRIARIMDISIQQPDNDWFGIGKVELGLSQGFNTASGSVAVMTSRDGVLWGAPVYTNTGAIGKYSDRLTWNYPGGLGRFQGYAGLRFYTTENIEFSADHIYADLK